MRKLKVGFQLFFETYLRIIDESCWSSTVSASHTQTCKDRNIVDLAADLSVLPSFQSTYATVPFNGVRTSSCAYKRTRSIADFYFPTGRIFVCEGHLGLVDVFPQGNPFWLPLFTEPRTPVERKSFELCRQFFPI